tara:strand:+ start:430 stop:642 length:213 start_codon:yes stop_codon:yes gene_type:complete
VKDALVVLLGFLTLNFAGALAKIFKLLERKQGKLTISRFRERRFEVFLCFLKKWQVNSFRRSVICYLVQL